MFKKFKTWLKFSPQTGTADEWTSWEDRYRAEAPIRYWITHTAPQTYWWPITHRVERFRGWFRYRFYRYHIVDTGLSPDYYDKDYLMLHVNFNLLKDYVEGECASMQLWSKDVKTPFMYRFKIYRELFWSSSELGLKHLDWEISLDDPALPEEERCPWQAVRAREIKELYLWWTETYANRVEVPYPVRDDHPNKSILYTMSDRYKQDFPEEAAATKAWCSDHAKQEKEWGEEEEAMLIRLMKTRSGLWS